MRTILFLFLFGIIAYWPAKGDCPMKETIDMKKSATTAVDKSLEPLFTAVLEYKSHSEQDAVVAADGHEGAYIGSGDGTLKGDRLRGTMKWSLWAGDCLYPLLRKGQAVPDGLHICTMNPTAFIQTEDGARIRFDGRGYGIRQAGQYRVSLTLVFGTEGDRYAWLSKIPAVVEGEFDEKAGRGTWNVYVPAGSH